MDKFITHAGQQPIFLGDIDFFDKAVRDTFANVLKIIARGYDNLILTGFNTDRIVQNESSSFIYKWSSGLVLIDGEIFPIEADQITVELSSDNIKMPCFSIQTIYDEAGRRTLKNGNSVDCYQLRKATIVLGDVGSKYRADTATRLDDIIDEHIKETVPAAYNSISGSSTSGSYQTDIHIIGFANGYILTGFTKKSSTNKVVATTTTAKDQYDNNPQRFIRGTFPLTLSDESFSNIRIIPGYLETFNDDGLLGFRVMATEDISKDTIVSFFANLYSLR